MKLIRLCVNNLGIFLQSENTNTFAIALFCKSLYIFLFFKIIFLWPVLPDIIRYVPLEFNSLFRYLVFAPLIITHFDVSVFSILLLIILLVGIIIRVNYFTAILIFWFSISLSRLALPVMNGSDLVLNLFLLISIFLPVTPQIKTSKLYNLQFISSNFAFLLCRFQLALIYLLSGFDKLTSSAWRSGDAIYSIVNLEYYMNPAVPTPSSHVVFMLVAWVTIIFELGFALLVWFRPFRIPFLVAGLIFHLGIIFFLSLPDFGILMILAYSLFVPSRINRMESSPVPQ